MKIQEIHFQRKDGRNTVLRNPCDDDIESMLQYLYQSATETEFIMRYPEECGKYTHDAEAQLFEKMNTSPDCVMIVCLTEGKLVGNCHMKRYSSLKTRHRAEVAIALLREAWGQGIGTKMFEEMIRIAKEEWAVSQIELDFVEGNTRARALYEKMGFRIVGVKPNAIRLKNGTLLNEYSMILEI